MPIEFDIDLEKVRTIVPPAKYKEIAKRVIQESLVKLTDYMVQEAPKNEKNLIDSIDYEFDSDSMTGEIFSEDCPYVKDVIYGTKPHKILPNSKKALYWEDLEHPVASVNHPGNKPNDFPQRALNRFKQTGFIEKRLAYYSSKWQRKTTSTGRRPGTFIGLGGRKMGAGRRR